jgi:hypothetical protein
MYALLDANVAAGYYLARSLNSQVAQKRITNIIDSVRTGGSKHFFYIPNISGRSDKSTTMLLGTSSM